MKNNFKRVLLKDCLDIGYLELMRERMAVINTMIHDFY